ncbi:MAG: universal stress protein [Anaerolineae bacterium]
MSAVRTSLLVARGPRWPLRRILAVTRGRHEDLGVAEWAAILAKSSGASITLQVVMPELPTACESYVRGAIMLQGRELSMPLGRQLQALRELHPAWAQTGVLRCRSGSPTAQVRREVADLDPDLVITGPDSASWLSRRLTGCLACGLVRDGERPVLVARSRSG